MSNIKRTISGGALAALVAVSSTVAAIQPAAASTGYLVATGDSYPAGDQAPAGTAFPNQMANALHLKLNNFSDGGAATADIVRQTVKTSFLAKAATANTVVINIGANDILYTHPDPRDAATSLWNYRPQLQSMNKNLQLVLYRISHVRHARNARVVVVDYNTVYRQGGSARWAGSTFIKGSDNVTKAVNYSIMNDCKKFHMTCVDVYSAFQGKNQDSLVSADGTHLSAAGQAVYARLIDKALRGKK